MKILFVTMSSFNINSSATIQNKGIIKGLFENGHLIDVLTLESDESFGSYDSSMNNISHMINREYNIPLSEKYRKFANKKINTPVDSGGSVKPKTYKLLVARIMAKIKKIYNSLTIFDAQKINVKNVDNVGLEINDYDLIISSSDPKSSHLIVMRLLRKNRFDGEWRQYWGDPMFHDITRKKSLNNHFIKSTERKIIRKADKVIYASPLTLKEQKASFPSEAYKMSFAAQPAVGDDKLSNSKSKPTTSEVKGLKFGYLGAYNSNIRNILPLYDSFKLINSNHSLDIVGGSNLTLESTSNVKIHPHLSYHDSQEIEREMDILIAICNLRGNQIPGKIYYMASLNKPILVLCDGENSNEVRDWLATYNRFILVDNREKSIADFINEMNFDLLEMKSDILDERLTAKYFGKKIADSNS